MGGISFIIVFFGILFYAYKFISEKARDDTYNSKERQVKVVSDFYFEKMKDVDFENEWKQKISSGIYKDRIFKECEEDLKFIFGDNWKNIVRIPSERTFLLKEKPFYKHEDLILRLILSKNGKFPRFEYHSGFLINRKNECEIKMGQCIERNLNACGLPVEFVFREWPVGSTAGYITFRHNQTTNYPKLW